MRGQHSHCQLGDYEESFLQTEEGVRLVTQEGGREDSGTRLATNVEQETEKRASFVSRPRRLRLFGIHRNFFGGGGGGGGEPSSVQTVPSGRHQSGHPESH